MPASPHLVAIFGGAVSGAEAAHQLARRGIRSVVFDQNLLPYGKIEDGLPKWHHKLRDKEEEKINEKLSHPLVEFVPGVALGRELAFADVVENWGFSAVLLAVGAWRDRPLPVPGVDAYVNKGLVYQNPFIYWYNHKHEPGYEGPRYHAPDGAIIVGGGLASLDVAKVFMFENVQRALAEHGQPTDIFELDRGIDKALARRDLTFEALGIRGCTLYYRRRPQDMPLTPMAADSPERLAKAQKVKRKILGNYQKKYHFHLQTLRMPVDTIVEEGRLKGLIFQKTRIEKGKVVPVPGALEKVRAPLIVSSIGSIPQPIPGIPMTGTIFKLITRDSCRLDGYEHVFALGNAVTGRGNIRESAEHGKSVAMEMAEQYLEYDSHHEFGYRSAERGAGNRMSNIAGQIHLLNTPGAHVREAITEKVRKLQRKAGYGGNFRAWVEMHRPVRLEEMLESRQSEEKR